MRQKPGPAKKAAEQVVKEIRRATRKHHSAEERIHIILEGLRGEDSIADLPVGGSPVQRVLPLVQGVPGGRQEAWLARTGSPARHPDGDHCRT
jgi:hypothetical protein